VQFDQPKRREFITLVGGAAAWPLVVRAQQAGKVVRIGFIGASLNSPAMAGQYQAFLSELRELGLGEGQNVIVDYRRIDDPRGPFAIAAELMRLQVDLVVATGPEVALQAVVGASRSIPIVILAVQYDPIARGYVESLARPGGNITGVFYRQPELAAKQLELLTQAFPEKSRFAVLYDANSADQLSAAEEAAKSMPLELRPARRRAGSRGRAPLARARSRASGCGASEYSWAWSLTIRKDRPVSRGFSRRYSNWAGSRAATCGSTSGGVEAMPTTFANTRRNVLRSGRTSFWPRP
jgi:hypothetical protein